MATTTTNYGLKKPEYSDTVDIGDINGNFETLDTELDKLSGALALIQRGDEATQNISKGQYVLWKGALKKATAAITSGETLSDSNLSTVSGGVTNALGTVETFENTVNGVTARGWKVGRIVFVAFARSTSYTISEWTAFRAEGIVPEGFRPPAEVYGAVATRGWGTFQVTQERNGSGHWSGPTLILSPTGNIQVGARGTMSCEYLYSSVTYICAEEGGET